MPAAVAALSQEAHQQLHQAWCEIVGSVWRSGGLSVPGAAAWMALLEAEVIRAAGIPDVKIDEDSLGVRIDELDALIGAAAVNNVSRGPDGGFTGCVPMWEEPWNGRGHNPAGFSGGSGGGVALWSPYRAGLPAEADVGDDSTLNLAATYDLPRLIPRAGRRRPLKLDGDDLCRRSYAVCHPTDLETPQPLEGAAS